MSSFNYKIKLAYDGTHYHGWQVQPNGITIQEILQTTLKQFIRTDIHVIGSGRTDAGVHALGQIANFKCDKEIDLTLFMKASNGLLPHDIRILSIEKVPLSFHARFSATGKIYHYYLCLDQVQNPFRRLYSWHIREKIDLTLLKQAAQLFVGTHDFATFANSAHEGSAAHDSIRTIKRLDVISQDSDIRLEFEADGFLYKMVRNITGTLIEVATHKIYIEDVSTLLISRDRRKAGKAAPPQGLFLASVDYS